IHLVAYDFGDKLAQDSFFDTIVPASAVTCGDKSPWFYGQAHVRDNRHKKDDKKELCRDLLSDS
ncbi:MAG: hypothetical protein U9Q07_14970, partial [Planctomycetota bacterium]|nr:hypothetical protein [Planctomycetota bacterium]